MINMFIFFYNSILFGKIVYNVIILNVCVIFYYDMIKIVMQVGIWFNVNVFVENNIVD